MLVQDRSPTKPVQDDFRGSRSSLLLILGLVVASFATYWIGVRHSHSGPGAMGLVDELTYPYWISIALLVLSLIISCQQSLQAVGLGALQFALLIVSLYLTPYALEGTPYEPTSFQSYAFVEPILRLAHLTPIAVWYHSWPGFPLTWAIIIRVTGPMRAETLMGVFPAFAEGALALAVLALGMRLTNSWAQSWVAALVFILGNWTGQDYFSPQAQAEFLLLIFMLALLLSDRVLLILVYVALAMTHVLTGLVALGIALSWGLVRRGLPLGVVGGLAGIFVCWQLYPGWPFTRILIPGAISKVYNLGAFFFYNFDIKWHGISRIRQIDSMFKVLLTGLVLGLAGLGAILNRREKLRSPWVEFLACSAVATTLILPISPYEGEALIRWYLYLLAAAAVAAAAVLVGYGRSSIVIATAVFTTAVPLHLISHYGSEVLRYTPPSDVAMSDFLYAHISHGTIMSFQPPPVYTRGLDLYTHIVAGAQVLDGESPDRTPFSRKFLASKLWGSEASRPPILLVVNDKIRDHMKYAFGRIPGPFMDTLNWLPSSDIYEAIYDTSSGTLYVRER